MSRPIFTEPDGYTSGTRLLGQYFGELAPTREGFMELVLFEVSHFLCSARDMFVLLCKSFRRTYGDTGAATPG